MSGSAIVLAAHGSRHEPSVNAMVGSLVERLGRLGLVDEVAAAFHQGVPAFSTVLDSLTADDITVVPLMTSDGYFSDVVLARELRKNHRFASVRVRRTPPVGTHPELVAIAAARVRGRLACFNLDPRETTLVVVGHGTRRHPRSRDATMSLTKALAAEGLCHDVIPALLDDCPTVETIPTRASQPNLLVLPFLISSGPHAVADLPRRLGLSVLPGATPPFAGRTAEHRIICDTPIGTDPAIVNIVAALARNKTSLRVETRP